MSSSLKLLKVQGPDKDIERLDRELAMYDVEHPSQRPLTAMVQMSVKGDDFFYKPDKHGRYTVVVFVNNDAVIDWVVDRIQRTGFVVAA